MSRQILPAVPFGLPTSVVFDTEDKAIILH